MNRDLKELRALCDAATQGEWEINWYICRMDITEIGPLSPDHCHWVGYNLGCSEEDAAFVSTTDPTTVRTLIDKIERLKEALKHYQHGWDKSGHECSQTGSPVYVKWSKYGGDIARKALKENEK